MPALLSPAVATVQVECASCGRPRWVSPERARRIARGVAPSNCRSCKGKPEESLSSALPEAVDDVHVRWWVEEFGGTIPTGVEAMPFLHAAGGRRALPVELGELVASLTHE